MKVNEFWDGVIGWYSINARNFLWRMTSNPYHILVAEFLLQQTHVRKVEEVYKKFLERFPDPESLIMAENSEVEEIIRPIGLIYRATRLKKCMELIFEKYSGHVPNEPKELKSLPGVGEYISNAVACYAFEKRTVPIDTNVIRIFCRYFGLKSRKARPHTDRALSDEIRVLFAQFKNTRTPNLAILDFAGAICTASNPKCNKCVINNGCEEYLKK